MSIRRISAIAVLMFTLGSTTAAIAVPSPVASPQTVAPQNKAPNRPAGKEGGVFDKLNLSADQKQKIQAVRDQYKGQITQRMEAVRQARQELKTMMAGTASASQIRDKNTQITGLKKQLDDVQLESTLAMREILTPAQRTQLAQLMKQRQEAAKNRMQNSPKPQ